MPLDEACGNTTVNDLLKNIADKYGSKTAVITGEGHFSFEDLDQLSLRMAKHLLGMGLRKGDVVAMQLPNSWQFIVAHLALSRIGLILNPLSTTYRKKELAFMLAHCETKAVITMDSWRNFNHEELMFSLKSELPQLEHVIVVGDKNQTKGVSFSGLIEKEPEHISEKELALHAPDIKDPMLLMFTSGTESNPKAVLHTFQTFIPSHLLVGQEYQITSQDTILCLTPMCHMFSLPMIMIGLTNGATQYVLNQYSIADVIEGFKYDQISVCIAAPAHLIDILHDMKGSRLSHSQLRLVLTGGTKIPSQMVKEVRRLFNCDVAAQWGMTEVCAGTFTRPGDEETLSWETVGRACPTGEVYIVDEGGSVLPAGESGEIAFSGDSLFIEYYRNESATKEAFSKDGFFLTGDLGWLDKNGYLHFVGRKKDTINRGGLKVHTAEIEEAIQMHPKIKQAAVVSVPDPRLGERGCAFVSVRKGAQFDFQEMVEFLIDKGFAKYKIPEYLEIRDTLSTTPSGKIMKGPLKQEAMGFEKTVKTK